MQDFHNLEVWKKAHQLALNLFKATGNQPKHDPFLTSQLRRLGTLIPARITEGAAKDVNGEFARCLQLSRGHCYELEYLLLLSRDLEYLDSSLHDKLLDQLVAVRKMLSGLLRAP
jgi:four helix bundle protein